MLKRTCVNPTEGLHMEEAHLCPKCLKTTLHMFVAQTIKNTGDGRIERLNEETYWKCVIPGCEYREAADGSSGEA